MGHWTCSSYEHSDCPLQQRRWIFKDGIIGTPRIYTWDDTIAKLKQVVHDGLEFTFVVDCSSDRTEVGDSISAMGDSADSTQVDPYIDSLVDYHTEQRREAIALMLHKLRLQFRPHRAPVPSGVSVVQMSDDDSDGEAGSEVTEAELAVLLELGNATGLLGPTPLVAGRLLELARVKTTHGTRTTAAGDPPFDRANGLLDGQWRSEFHSLASSSPRKTCLNSWGLRLKLSSPTPHTGEASESGSVDVDSASGSPSALAEVRAITSSKKMKNGVRASLGRLVKLRECSCNNTLSHCTECEWRRRRRGQW